MSTRRTAALWFTGGIAFLVAGLMSEPRNLLTFVAAIAFFAVGIASILRSS